MRTVIIGNGVSGNKAAETIRRQKPDWEVVMISREALPAYSACALPDCLAGWVSRDDLFIKSFSDYRELSIRTEFGKEVRLIDTASCEVVLEDRKIEYDRLILASGSRALIPPLTGVMLEGNFILKSVFDLERIMAHRPKQVVIVGSGNIGVEAAEALELRGCEVTIIEMLDRVMPKVFDEKPSAIIRRLLEENGVRVLTGEKVMEVRGSGKVEGIITDAREIPCDTVIWAVGVRQNVETAREAGIDIGSLGGIKVNSRMETNIEGIYACGDCIESFSLVTRRPELSLLWPSAKRQGEIAGLNCSGKPAEYEGSFTLVVEEICGKNCVSMGSTGGMQNDIQLQVIENEDKDCYFRLLLDNGRIAGFQGIGHNEGLGAIMALIKTKTQLSEVKRVLETRELLTMVPWFAGAARYLMGGGDSYEF